MVPKSEPDTSQKDKVLPPAAGTFKTAVACISGALIPGLGHALLQKWDRAVVFFCSISIMLGLGLYLNGRLFGPEFDNFFSILKFIANAGNGLLYWIPWMSGMGLGDPTVYTYDYANVFIYVAGLLNMLIVVDVFDVAMGRKQ